MEDSEHRKISAPGVQRSPHGSYERHKAKGLQEKNCIDSCSFCSFCGKIVVDTVEVTPLVDSSGNVFTKLIEELLFGKNISAGDTAINNREKNL